MESSIICQTWDNTWGVTKLQTWVSTTCNCGHNFQTESSGFLWPPQDARWGGMKRTKHRKIMDMCDLLHYVLYSNYGRGLSNAPQLVLGSTWPLHLVHRKKRILKFAYCIYFLQTTLSGGEKSSYTSGPPWCLPILGANVARTGGKF